MCVGGVGGRGKRGEGGRAIVQPGVDVSGDEAVRAEGVGASAGEEEPLRRRRRRGGGRKGRKGPGIVGGGPGAGAGESRSGRR